MRWAIHYMRHALATLRALSSAIHKDQSRRQVWAKGLSPLHNCLASTVKHTGQESGSELCEICKHWSFLKSKSVNNVCLSASASRRLDPLPGLRPWTPLGDFPKFVIVVFIIVGPLNSVLTVHIIWCNGWCKYASKCTDLHVTIQFFRGLCPRTQMLGRGYSAHLQTPPPRYSGAARLPRLARGLNRPAPQCLLAVYATVHHAVSLVCFML